jgi:hypothetical protein
MAVSFYSTAPAFQIFSYLVEIGLRATIDNERLGATKQLRKMHDPIE